MTTTSSMPIRWCKFNLVGALGIVVQFAALFLLKSLLHFNYLAATALAVEAAVLHNFWWHERFTWSDRTCSARTSPDHVPSTSRAAWHKARKETWSGARRLPLARFLRFNLTTGIVSIAGNVGLMRLLVGMEHMNYLAANAVAIALCSLANFLVSDGWVFSRT
ncbi:MAG TPA: GtrA family protein [Candidatus Sulfotelmatobacter sp.]